VTVNASAWPAPGILGGRSGIGSAVEPEDGDRAWARSSSAQRMHQIDRIAKQPGPGQLIETPRSRLLFGQLSFDRHDRLDPFLAEREESRRHTRDIKEPGARDVVSTSPQIRSCCPPDRAEAIHSFRSRADRPRQPVPAQSAVHLRRAVVHLAGRGWGEGSGGAGGGWDAQQQAPQRRRPTSTNSRAARRHRNGRITSGE